MGLGRQKARQADMFIAWNQIPKSRGHAFFDRLQSVLHKSGFDRFVENLCKPHYASHKGRPFIPPGRYFRMHLVGYFEGIDSERGLEWRCADSLSLREFLQLKTSESVPDHFSLSRIRSRLPLEVHSEVFTWVLQKIADAGLVLGGRIGVDASTMEANAALRTIVRRDTGENYRQMLTRMAKESGIETPKAEDLVRMDKNRKDKKLSNKDWESPIDPDSKIARMKDGRTHMGYKPEHAVDLDTGAIVGVEIYPADQGDTTTLKKTLTTTAENLEKTTPTPPCPDDPAELCADKGYHSREVLKELEGGPWKTRIAEPKPKGLLNWKGDHEARRAVYNNRARVSSGAGKWVGKLRTELVERSFAHTLDRGGMRRVWLRGLENIQKRYLIHVTGFNLGLLMRKLIGYGTPKGTADGLGAAMIMMNSGSFCVLAFFLLTREHEVVVLAFYTANYT
ncbi:transposase, IS5 family [Desulfonatronum zhilinae]|nr:transposase, IS5 family [Desulfonatronum zhilinae]